METHFSEHELSQRWRISRRSLQRWRAEGLGPAYLRLNGRVIYAIEDVIAFEAISRIPASLKPARGQ